MILFLLLLGAFICALALLGIDFWIGVYTDPNRESDKIDDIGMLQLFVSIVALALSINFLFNNYQEAFEYPEPVSYIILGIIVSLLIAPVLFTVAIIIDSIIKAYRQMKNRKLHR